MHLDKQGRVFVLRLDETENRFNVGWVAEFVGLLDTVEADPGPKALVTAGVGKFWSNGLDLEWMLGHPAEATALAPAVHEMFARVLVAGIPTVAALQGHAYAAGAMLALAHDYRVMRSDRGFICFPEIDIRIPFTRGMTALVSGKLSPTVARDAMLFGRRYGAVDARQAGLVDDAVDEAEVLSTSIALAETLADKDSATLAAIKRELHRSSIHALRQAEGNELPDLTR